MYAYDMIAIIKIFDTMHTAIWLLSSFQTILHTRLSEEGLK